MRHREEYLKVKAEADKAGLSHETLTDKQISDCLEKVDFTGKPDSWKECIKGCIRDDLRIADLKAQRQFIMNALRGRWPDVIIEEGDCRKKAMFHVWPLGKE